MVAAIPQKDKYWIPDNLVAYCPEGHAMKSDEL